jgi:hypothetical protein
MPDTGETAPTFTATVGTSNHESFDLADHLGDETVTYRRVTDDPTTEPGYEEILGAL